MNNPDLVTQFPYMIRSAMVFWLSNNCWQSADQGITNAAIDAVTKIVNPGELKNHAQGKYSDVSKDPLLNRRIYTRLAFNAFV